MSQRRTWPRSPTGRLQERSRRDFSGSRELGQAFLGGPPPQRCLRRRRRNAARRAVQPREVHPRLRDMSRTCRGRVLDVRGRERCVRTMSSSSSRQASMARSSACAVRESSRTSCFSSRTAYLAVSSTVIRREWVAPSCASSRTASSCFDPATTREPTTLRENEGGCTVREAVRGTRRHARAVDRAPQFEQRAPHERAQLLLPSVCT